ncbi:MAG: single-stranded-DNA-specific exonuclease RecJ [Leptospiraceae bacterium]|nr:single-stranded-DNA-specific exonuclease RecJ [Leptospiraceae bacterium]MCP5499311.1 single-stranded-DNA-specific exonuclease RecJ [Leptospiraceae bacterium]
MEYEHGVAFSSLPPSPYKDLSRFQAFIFQKLVPEGVSGEEFLGDSYRFLHSPFLLPDIIGAIELIKDSINQKKHILLYGDRDTDGVSSTSLLYCFLRGIHAKSGGKLSVKTSSANDDYGLCDAAVQNVKKIKPDLLITLDFGSTNYDEINSLVKEKISVIVLDHHEIPLKLPDCFLVNPKREDSVYPEKRICTSVLAMKLIQAYLAYDYLQKENGAYYENALGLKPDYTGLDFYSLYERFPDLQKKTEALFDLAAIGTITDMMPLQGENRVIVKNGLKTLQGLMKEAKPERYGLSYLLKELNLNPEKIVTKDLGWSIGPVLNAAGRMGKTEVALELLLEEDSKKAQTIALNLIKLNESRKDRTKRNIDRVERYFKRKPERTQAKVLFCYEPDMEPGVSGIVATRLVQEYKRPVVFVTPDHGNARGSIRSYGTENVIELMKMLEDLFIHYGGHPEAGGFSIEIPKIPVLEKRLQEVAIPWLDLPREDKKEELKSIVSFEPKELNEKVYYDITMFEPFGQENPQPLLSLGNVKVISYRPMGNGTHARFGILGADISLKAVIWGRAKEFEAVLSKKSFLELWGRMEENYFNGNVTIQFIVEHFR